MKKVIFPILLLIALGSIYLGYKKFGNIATDAQHPLTVFSEDTPAILQVNNLSNQWSKLTETNSLWKKILSGGQSKEILSFLDKVSIALEKHAEICHQIDQSPSCLAFFPNENSTNFTFVTSVGSSAETEINEILSSIGFLNPEIGSKPTKVSSKGQSVYVLLKNQLLVISNSESNIQLAARNIVTNYKVNLDSGFQKIYATTEPSGLNLFFKPSKFNSKLASKLTTWFGLEVKFNSNQITLSGFSSEIDSNEISNAKHIDVYSAIPDNTTLLEWTCYESFEQHKALEKDNILISNTNTYFKTNATKDFSSWIDNQHVIFWIPNQKDPIIACIENGSGIVNSVINKYAISDSVFTKLGKTTVIPLNPSFNTSALFGINAKQSKSYFFLLNGFGYFAPNLTSIGQILSSVNSNKTLSNSESFLKSNTINFNKKANWFLFSQDPEKHIKDLVSYGLPNNLINASTTVGWQKKTNKNQLTFHHILFNSNSLKNNSKGIDNVSSINVTLDTIIRRKPWTTFNHKTSTKELLVETKSNTLSRINANGILKWSVKLDGEIQGEIQEVDILNNNKVQTIFNTNSSIYLLDINGNSVNGFPIRLPQKASNSISVLDYDKTKEYRFLIGLNNGQIVSYDKQGKRVEGWNFTTAEGLILGQIKHIRIGSKDYICMTSENGKVFVLDRKGATRLEVPHNSGSANNYILKGKSIQSSKIVYADSNNHHFYMTFDGVKKALDLDSSFNNPKIKFIKHGAKNADYLVIYDRDNIHLFDWQFGLKKIIPHALNSEFIDYSFEGGKHYFSLKGNSENTYINEFSELVYKTKSSLEGIVSDLNMDQNLIHITTDQNQLILKHIH